MRLKAVPPLARAGLRSYMGRGAGRRAQTRVAGNVGSTRHAEIEEGSEMNSHSDEQSGYYSILVADVAEALKQAHDTADLSARRSAIRAMFAAIEGGIAHIKQMLLLDAEIAPGSCSPAEMALLREENYSVDERGNSRTRPQFISLPQNIRLTVRLFRKLHGDALDPEFGHPGWQSLGEALKVRHRLTHPRSKEDLAVTTDELQSAFVGFMWFLALAVDAMHLMRSEMEARVQEMARYLPDLSKGK